MNLKDRVVSRHWTFKKQWEATKGVYVNGHLWAFKVSL